MARISLVLFLVLSIASVTLVAQPGPAKSDQEKLDESIATLQDLYLKKVTLCWLADERSAERLAAILENFEPGLQSNFMANITGDYRTVILKNYDSVIESHEKNLLEWASKDGFANAEVLAAMVANVDPKPMAEAFAGALRAVKTRLDYQAVQERTDELVRLKSVIDNALIGILDSRVDYFELGETLYAAAEPEDVPVWWFDDRQYEIFTARPIEDVDEHAQIDLNSVTVTELTSMPGVDGTMAEAIVAYRTAAAGFNGLAELKRVEGVDEGTYRSLSPLLKVVPVAKPKKKWTVMVWLNADNDLERFGLSDVNEMEIVGSTEDVNIVVQIDRCKTSHGTNMQGNWSGARRYYVMQDQDRNEIGSPIIDEVGEADMGSPNELAEFGRWCVEYYPADRYVLTIWNHGAGWQGISYDDQSYFHLSVPDVMTAVKSIAERMNELQPKKEKLDIVDFDACLMALLEVGYEIEPVVEVMLASQLEEPGQGMPYDDYLLPLAADPAMSTDDFAKVMVEKFILSYVKDGSQNPGYWADITTSTKSAVRLKELPRLVASVNQLAERLLADFNLYSKLREANSRSLALIRAFKDNRENFDLYHLVAALQSAEGVPNDIKAICQDIRSQFGWRFKGIDVLDRPKVVRSKQAGYVLWGINGWQLPPDSLYAPVGELYHSRYIRTALDGPDDKGWYRATLIPFTQIPAVVDGRRKKVLIETIDYQIVSSDGTVGERRSARRSRTKEYRIETMFPETSPLIAEGHTQGMSNAHGLSIYFPYPLEFARPYQDLRFSKDTSWDELVSRVPEYRGFSDGLLCGPVLVGRAPAASRFTSAVGAVGKSLDLLREPAVFGFDFPSIFEQYRNGFAIVTGLDQNSFNSKKLAPSAREVLDYVRAGGRVLLFSRKEHESNLYASFFREIGAEYDSSQQRELTLVLPNGMKSTTGLKDGWKFFFGNIAIRPCNGAESFLETEDGLCLGTYHRVGAGAIVYVATRFECIDDEQFRTALVKAALEKLAIR